MKCLFSIGFAIVLLSFSFSVAGQTQPDFKWGNSAYFNLSIGESIWCDSTEIKLLRIENRYNTLKVGHDTLCLKASGRSLPHASSTGLPFFVADNKNLKALSVDSTIHGLLKEDVLLCVAGANKSLLEKQQFVFPVNFSHGFTWGGDEDAYMYSFLYDSKKQSYETFPGIGIDLDDAKGLEKHWLVALENSTVVWIDKQAEDRAACVLLASESYSGIYYVYDNLYDKNLEVKKGQNLTRGELIGTAWGDADWGHVHLAVVYSDTIPSYKNRFANCINFFPQLYELYYGHIYNTTKSYSKGQISFGKAISAAGAEKNNDAFEEYLGKGWIWGSWNVADKLASVSKREEGNVRMEKQIFSGTPAQCVNPRDYFDYEINVKNGVYRIRAKVGDVDRESWQKIEYEGVMANTLSLARGVQEWTDERIVKVEDRKLTVRIYIDPKHQKVAGLSEIVFQMAY
ncbi:M23 family metallopeptidase [Maribellus sp. YY47]|uniref:M23 family metallopeptidase n=1 Tax=Maribellus sp. YY47 TaxID=2929486 RepID=UPI002000DD23|nr:M23 family metallopeptidase [Maribellus sp. YY47]MCK3684923.1 M23 family metallopeptidase [Maribellus sp. YY47]